MNLSSGNLQTYPKNTLKLIFTLHLSSDILKIIITLLLLTFSWLLVPTGYPTIKYPMMIFIVDFAIF